MIGYSFPRICRQLADAHADRIALINTERNRIMSYRALHELSNRAANAMSGPLGLRAGDRYALILENDNLSFMHCASTFKCAATALVCNIRDTIEEHVRQIETVKAKAVFIESALAEEYAMRLAPLNVRVVAMDGEVRSALSFWELVEAACADEPATDVDWRSHPLFLRFTGGTTGASKCAIYSHASFDFLVSSFLALPDRPFHRETRALHLAPMSHASFMIASPTFFAGGCNITQNKPDLGEWCLNVEKHGINTSFMVPTLLYRLLGMDEAKSHDLSTLQTIIYGAAPMSAVKLSELQARFGNIFLQLYGATESPGAITCLTKADHDLGVDGAPKRLQSCGRPLPTGELKVADETGCELPRGEIGELWHRHRGVIQGYLDDPDASAAEFADGWWKSGDLATIDDQGYCYIVDRKKDMIITGGFNVYATEVENALASHPNVLMCAVVAAPHEEWGEAVVAEVVLRRAGETSAPELIDHVKGEIGAYKAPKLITYVSELPVSAVGKVLRKAVRAKYWQGQTRRVS